MLVLGSIMPLFQATPDNEKDVLLPGVKPTQLKSLCYLSLKSKKVEREEVSFLDKDGRVTKRQVIPWKLLK